MTDAELEEMFRTWESPASLYALEGEEDALALDGILPLPGLSRDELVA
jgi:hypothetical protein